MKNRTIIAITLLFSTFWITSVQAQGCDPTDPESCRPVTDVGGFSGLPIDLLPPGARALGLGGAFTAVADDATAALANPAGLTNLSAPEVSLFVRYSDTDVNFLDSDAFNSAINAIAGHTNKVYSDSSADVSFASFVIPMDEFVFSGFYSNQLNFSATQSLEDDYWDRIPRLAGTPNEWAFLDRYTNVNSVEASVENVGISAAFRFTEGFSGGLTIRNSKLDLKNIDTWQSQYFNDWEWFYADIYNVIYNEGRRPTVDDADAFLPVTGDDFLYSSIIDGSSEELVVDIGAYYRADKWSFGAVYHSGSKFTFDQVGSVSSIYNCSPVDRERFDICQASVDFFNAIPSDPDNPDSPPVTSIWYPNTSSTSEITIKLPSVFSFGVAWRPADTWLVSLDINYIKYSVLNEPRHITLGFNADINNEEERSLWYDPDVSSISGPITEPISNGTTFHIGAEKSFFFDSGILRTLALRGGVFNNVDHDGLVATDNDEIIYTVGLGSTWGKNELGAKVFQMDLGASIADNATNIVLSGIFRF